MIKTNKKTQAQNRRAPWNPTPNTFIPNLVTQYFFRQLFFSPIFHTENINIMMYIFNRNILEQ